MTFPTPQPGPPRVRDSGRSDLEADADDEALGPVVEVVEVDDGDLRVRRADLDRGRPRSFTSAADQMAERTLRRAQPADERVHRARRRGRPRRVLAGALVLDAVADEVDKLAERRDRVARRSTTCRRRRGAPVALRAGRRRRGSPSCTAALVLSVGEQEGQELSARRTGDRPVVGVRPSVRVAMLGRHMLRSFFAGRPVDGDRVERDGLEAHAPVALTVLVGEAMLAWSRNSRSSPFTLKISALVLIASAPSTPELKRRRGGTWRRWSWSPRRDAADVHVRAAGAVEELEVEIERLVTMIDTDGELGLHLIEVERLVASCSLGAVDCRRLVGAARRSPAPRAS